jgi:hypothetical protein
MFQIIAEINVSSYINYLLGDKSMNKSISVSFKLYILVNWA